MYREVFAEHGLRPADSAADGMLSAMEKSKNELDWRAPVPSVNILITSLVWRQDHNGFTHQDP
jgi:phosphoketolase